MGGGAPFREGAHKDRNSAGGGGYLNLDKLYLIDSKCKHLEVTKCTRVSLQMTSPVSGAIAGGGALNWGS